MPASEYPTQPPSRDGGIARRNETMTWMNASAASAADRRNAELSSWDHSVESPDGYGRRDADDRHLAAAVDAEEARKDALRAQLVAIEAAKQERSAAEALEFARLPDAIGPEVDAALTSMRDEVEFAVNGLGREPYDVAAKARPDGTVLFYHVRGERAEIVFARKF